jgi:hypothetical protein
MSSNSDPLLTNASSTKTLNVLSGNCRQKTYLQFQGQLQQLCIGIVEVECSFIPILEGKGEAFCLNNFPQNERTAF